MPLYLAFIPAFKRSLKNLSKEQAKIIGLILDALMIYYKNGCNIDKARKVTPRFFYKQLRKPFYEAGVEGKLRVIIRRNKEECVAIICGNHDQIVKFLSKL